MSDIFLPLCGLCNAVFPLQSVTFKYTVSSSLLPTSAAVNILHVNFLVSNYYFFNCCHFQSDQSPRTNTQSSLSQPRQRNHRHGRRDRTSQPSIVNGVETAESGETRPRLHLAEILSREVGNLTTQIDTSDSSSIESSRLRSSVGQGFSRGVRGNSFLDNVDLSRLQNLAG